MVSIITKRYYCFLHIAIMLLILFCVPACKGFRLLPTSGSLPLENNAFVERRIRNGYQLMALAPSLSVDIDSPHSTHLALADEIQTAPYSFKFTNTDPNNGGFSFHITAADWEYIQIRQDYSGNVQGCLKTDENWQTGDVNLTMRAPFIAFSLISGPYSIYFEPPHGLTSNEQMTGFNFSDSGISEVYTVAFQAPDSNGNLQTFNAAEIWIDSMSGLPVLSRSDTVTLTYKIDNSITIDPPCSNHC